MYKILIVEDEKWIRKGLRAMLFETATNSISGIYEASDAKQGYDMWQAEKPEIVISDVRMPGDDGCSMCEKIYAAQPGTEFIIISGYNEFEYVRRALGFKAADYLLKPVSKENLITVVDQCIQNIAAQKGEEKQAALILEKQRKRSENEIVKEVVNAIENNYNKKITLSKLATDAFISESYLSSLFKKSLGISPIQYITNLRINAALDYLNNTNLKINDISAMVGYPDQTYFTKVFKRVTGKNPTDFRQKGDA